MSGWRSSTTTRTTATARRTSSGTTRGCCTSRCTSGRCIPGRGASTTSAEAPERGPPATSRSLPERPVTYTCRAFDDVIEPIVERFDPTWVLVSAGYDAHRADPLTGLALSAGDYAVLAARVAALAPPGRLILFLEGGYDLDRTPRLDRGDPAGPDRRGAAGVAAPTAGGPGTSVVAEARARWAGRPGRFRTRPFPADTSCHARSRPTVATRGRRARVRRPSEGGLPAASPGRRLPSRDAARSPRTRRHRADRAPRGRTRTGRGGRLGHRGRGCLRDPRPRPVPGERVPPTGPRRRGVPTHRARRPRPRRARPSARGGQLADANSGMVLVAGLAGSGRTSTLAALVDHVNAARAPRTSSPSSSRSKSCTPTSARSSTSAKSVGTRRASRARSARLRTRIPMSWSWARSPMSTPRTRRWRSPTADGS